MSSLKGKVAIVTGGSRGVGKGIAMALGQTGATVYITGRTSSHDEAPTLKGQPLGGTLEETVEEVNRLGGKGIAVKCDHRDDEQVKALFDRVRQEQGTLDLLVNNAYQWHESILLGKSFWELPMAIWDNQSDVGLRSAYAASIQAAQIMVPNKRGLIVNVSSPPGGGYLLAASYGVISAALDRLSSDMAHELRPHGVASVSIWPGLIITEKTELLRGKNPSPFRKGAARQETPFHVGRAVVALASDAAIMNKSGTVMTTGDIGLEYGFTDLDGERPANVRDIFWPPPPLPVYRPLDTTRH